LSGEHIPFCDSAKTGLQKGGVRKASPEAVEKGRSAIEMRSVSCGKQGKNYLRGSAPQARGSPKGKSTQPTEEEIPKTCAQGEGKGPKLPTKKNLDRRRELILRKKQQGYENVRDHPRPRESEGTGFGGETRI